MSNQILDHFKSNCPSGSVFNIDFFSTVPPEQPAVDLSTGQNRLYREFELLAYRVSSSPSTFATKCTNRPKLGAIN